MPGTSSRRVQRADVDGPRAAGSRASHAGRRGQRRRATPPAPRRSARPRSARSGAMRSMISADTAATAPARRRDAAVRLAVRRPVRLACRRARPVVAGEERRPPSAQSKRREPRDERVRREHVRSHQACRRGRAAQRAVVAAYSAATPATSVGSSRRIRAGRCSDIRGWTGNVHVAVEQRRRQRRAASSGTGSRRAAVAPRGLRMRLARMRSGGRIMPAAHGIGVGLEAEGEHEVVGGARRPVELGRRAIRCRSARSCGQLPDDAGRGAGHDAARRHVLA